MTRQRRTTSKKHEYSSFSEVLDKVLADENLPAIVKFLQDGGSLGSVCVDFRNLEKDLHNPRLPFYFKVIEQSLNAELNPNANEGKGVITTAVLGLPPQELRSVLRQAVEGQVKKQFEGQKRAFDKAVEQARSSLEPKERSRAGSFSRESHKPKTRSDAKRQKYRRLSTLRRQGDRLRSGKARSDKKWLNNQVAILQLMNLTRADAIKKTDELLHESVDQQAQPSAQNNDLVNQLKANALAKLLENRVAVLLNDKGEFREDARAFEMWKNMLPRAGSSSERASPAARKSPVAARAARNAAASEQYGDPSQPPVAFGAVASQYDDAPPRDDRQPPAVGGGPAHSVVGGRHADPAAVRGNVTYGAAPAANSGASSVGSRDDVPDEAARRAALLGQYQDVTLVPGFGGNSGGPVFRGGYGSPSQAPADHGAVAHPGNQHYHDAPQNGSSSPYAELPKRSGSDESVSGDDLLVSVSDDGDQVGAAAAVPRTRSDVAAAGKRRKSSGDLTQKSSGDVVLEDDGAAAHTVPLTYQLRCDNDASFFIEVQPESLDTVDAILTSILGDGYHREYSDGRTVCAIDFGDDEQGFFNVRAGVLGVVKPISSAELVPAATTTTTTTMHNQGTASYQPPRAPVSDMVAAVGGGSADQDAIAAASQRGAAYGQVPPPAQDEAATSPALRQYATPPSLPNTAGNPVVGRADSAAVAAASGVSSDSIPPQYSQYDQLPAELRKKLSTHVGTLVDRLYDSNSVAFASGNMDGAAAKKYLNGVLAALGVNDELLAVLNSGVDDRDVNARQQLFFGIIDAGIKESGGVPLTRSVFKNVEHNLDEAFKELAQKRGDAAKQRGRPSKDGATLTRTQRKKGFSVQPAAAVAGGNAGSHYQPMPDAPAQAPDSGQYDVMPDVPARLPSDVGGGVLAAAGKRSDTYDRLPSPLADASAQRGLDGQYDRLPPPRLDPAVSHARSVFRRIVERSAQRKGVSETRDDGARKEADALFSAAAAASESEAVSASGGARRGDAKPPPPSSPPPRSSAPPRPGSPSPKRGVAVGRESRDRVAHPSPARGDASATPRTRTILPSATQMRSLENRRGNADHARKNGVNADGVKAVRDTVARRSNGGRPPPPISPPPPATRLPGRGVAEERPRSGVTAAYGRSINKQRVGSDAMSKFSSEYGSKNDSAPDKGEQNRGLRRASGRNADRSAQPSRVEDRGYAGRAASKDSQARGAVAAVTTGVFKRVGGKFDGEIERRGVGRKEKPVRDSRVTAVDGRHKHRQHHHRRGSGHTDGRGSSGGRS